ncbi:MAG: hypothetical protein P8P79_14270 [Halioglobus sp.]|nr:hypothetical protein [Halioglobus sp.]
MQKKNNNKFKQLTRLLLALPILLGTLTAHAGHDDTTLRTLQVTVSDVSGADVTIDISGIGVDSESLASAYLGTQFRLDSNFVGPWNPTNPPAINWGDGNTVAATAIPFTGTTPGYGDPDRTFTGEFMHTYAAPGNYTISVFGANVYAQNSSDYGPDSGTYSVSSPSLYADSSSYATGLQPIGILQRISVAVGSGAASPVPLLPNLALLALGALLILFGAAALRRV